MRHGISIVSIAAALLTTCSPDEAPLSGTGTDGGILSYLCEAGLVPDGGEIDPERPNQVEGGNGVAIDHCDDLGNLVEAVCETITECGPGPNPDCTTTQTGNTAELEFDCSGRCTNASCLARCPDFGDELRYLEVGDAVRLVNVTDGREYLCYLLNDAPNDDYDCTNDPAPESTTSVEALGLSGSHCTGGTFGNIQTEDGCSYTCDIPPA